MHELTQFAPDEYLIVMPPNKIQRIWSEVATLLKKDPDLLSDDVTTDDLLKSCLASDYQLWVYTKNRKIEACVFSEIVLHSTGKKSLMLHFAAGQNREHWTKSLPIVEAWSVQYDCSKVRMTARKGWIKLLSPLNYGYKHILLEKRLDNGRFK
jgi:hypothetical protein